jgi:polysaccharide biosynthesis protein PslH
MAQFKPADYTARSVWCLEDPPVLKSRRILPLSPWYKRPLVWLSAKRLQRYEIVHARKFDRVILVNRVDAQDYKSILKGAGLEWVPSGIDVDTFKPSSEISRRAGRIVITGNMFHPPNVDAVEYFCGEVFPLICARVPNATLWLVGAGPVRSIRKWTRDPRIKVTGFVPDIRPYLQEAMVSACPVRLKIGTQTKVLEALACGTPVVTTPEGNHGIGGASGQELFVAQNAAEFADQVVRLLTTDTWAGMSEKGRKFVEDNFTWEKSVAKLEQILEGLAAKPELDCVPH